MRWVGERARRYDSCLVTFDLFVYAKSRSRKMDMEYIAAGANRHPSCADWSGDLLAYGSGRNVALWRPHVSSGFLLPYVHGFICQSLFWAWLWKRGRLGISECKFTSSNEFFMRRGGTVILFTDWHTGQRPEWKSRCT